MSQEQWDLEAVLFLMMKQWESQLPINYFHTRSDSDIARDFGTWLVENKYLANNVRIELSRINVSEGKPK
jgi:hypothetical protein